MDNLAEFTDVKLIETPLDDPYINQFVRPSNLISAGIIGLPNRCVSDHVSLLGLSSYCLRLAYSGKTSLFNLITGEAAMTDPHLFCTIGLRA